MRLVALLPLLLPTTALAEGNSIHGKVMITSGGTDPGPAIVYVTGFSAPTKGTKDLEIIQKDERFEPAFLPIVQGQSVRFVNKDSKSHNVFSNSEVRKFDLGTADPEGTAKVTFTKLGLVDIFCNIHPTMEMKVLVLPNPAFAVVSGGSEYRITGIPDGKIKVFAWHPQGKPHFKEAELKGGQKLKLDWSLTSNQLNTPHLNKYGRPYRDKKKY